MKLGVYLKPHLQISKQPAFGITYHAASNVTLLASATLNTIASSNFAALIPLFLMKLICFSSIGCAACPGIWSQSSAFVPTIEASCSDGDASLHAVFWLTILGSIFALKLIFVLDFTRCVQSNSCTCFCQCWSIWSIAPIHFNQKFLSNYLDGKKYFFWLKWIGLSFIIPKSTDKKVSATIYKWNTSYWNRSRRNYAKIKQCKWGQSAPCCESKQTWSISCVGITSVCNQK